MTLKNTNITPIPNNEPDAIPALWNTRYDEIDENFQDLDKRTSSIEQEVIEARGTFPSVPIAIANVEDRIAKVETDISGVDAASVAQIKRATHLDWLYRYDRINFEFFRADYTLIDKAPTAVSAGILGDDSIDVESTAGIIAGDYYVLSDNDTTVMIRVKAVLSAQRLRLQDSLDKQWDSTATISLHNFTLNPLTNDATGRIGAIWLSKTINIGNKSGKVVLRCSNGAGTVKLFYRAADDAVWLESDAVLQDSSANEVPAGFVDYGFDIPLPENIKLRVEVEGEAVTIQHIVAFGLQYLDVVNQRISEMMAAQNVDRIAAQENLLAAKNLIEARQAENEFDWQNHLQATKLDWSYRYDRMSFEAFTPDYTLINKPIIGIREPAVSGSNVIDVGDSTHFEVGDYYVLSDSTHTKLIKVAAIHTDNIITIEGKLDRRWDIDSKVGKCNFDVLSARNAVAKNGAMWISKPIAVSLDALDGFAVIRRSYSAAEVKLFWMDDTHHEWQESVATLREVGGSDSKDGIPVGFADYQYALPLSSVGKIRIEVVDPSDSHPVTIQHIVTVGLFNTQNINNRISTVAADLLDAKEQIAAIQSSSDTGFDLRLDKDEFDFENLRDANFLDFAYRSNKVSIEFFTPDFTLINKPVITIREPAVLNSNVIDVGDTRDFAVGDYYVLSDTTHTKLIQVADIHTDNVITIVGKLDKRWDVGSTVSKCNFSISSKHATANDGSMWISRGISISNEAQGGTVILRRTHSDTQVKLFWLDAGVPNAAWQESIGAIRRIGSIDDIDRIPVGFADYQYSIPSIENVKLRLEVVGDPIVIASLFTCGLQYLDVVNQRIAALNARQLATETSVYAIEERQDLIDLNFRQHRLAYDLDWAYRSDRMNFEFFMSEYTLINRPVTAIREPAVLGDNTIDVGNTSHFDIGDYYVLHEGGHGHDSGEHTKLIKVAAIHTDNIITIEGVLDRRWEVGSTVSKCNLTIIGANNAVGNDGEMWISRKFTVSNDGNGGRVIIRRTHNDAEIKLFWLDDMQNNWQESVGTLRKIGEPDDEDGIAIGFADYQYHLPISGAGKIRIEIVDPLVTVNGVSHYNTRPITIQHIVTAGIFDTTISNVTNVTSITSFNGGTY